MAPQTEVQEKQQWARPDEDGFAAEIIDFNPAGLFHESVVFHPVQPELVGWIDEKYQWNGEYWDEPDLGYTAGKKVKAAEAAFAETVQERLDGFAATRGYNDITTACTYATSTNARFAAEGQYCVGARDATWEKAYELLAEYAGTGEIPEWTAEVVKELPKLEWPAE